MRNLLLVCVLGTLLTNCKPREFNQTDSGTKKVISDQIMYWRGTGSDTKHVYRAMCVGDAPFASSQCLNEGKEYIDYKCFRDNMMVEVRYEENISTTMEKRIKQLEEIAKERDTGDQIIYLSRQKEIADLKTKLADFNDFMNRKLGSNFMRDLDSAGYKAPEAKYGSSIASAFNSCQPKVTYSKFTGKENRNPRVLKFSLVKNLECKYPNKYIQNGKCTSAVSLNEFYGYCISTAKIGVQEIVQEGDAAFYISKSIFCDFKDSIDLKSIFEDSIDASSIMGGGIGYLK